MYDRILVPLDGSDLSQRILDYGHRLLEGRAAVLLRVLPANTTPRSPLEEEAQRLLETTAATAEEGAAASEELSAQAELSLSLADELERFVDGSASTAPGAPSGSSVASTARGARHAGTRRMKAAA